MCWKFEELTLQADKIRLNHEKKEKLKEAFDSIGIMQDIFKYHFVSFHEAKDLISNASTVEQAARILKHAAGQKDEQEEYEKARIALQAHIIACAHTARNICDVFAQIVNLMLIPSDIKEEKVSFNEVNKEVKKELKKCTFKKELEDICKSLEYKYTSKFSNISKHRHIIRTEYNHDLIRNKTSFRIKPFDVYEEYSLEKALELFESLINNVIKSGRALNSHLKNRQTKT